jgi:hypothetical protein
MVPGSWHALRTYNWREMYISQLRPQRNTFLNGLWHRIVLTVTLG